MLSSDGRVAEQGSYKDLSNNPDGAFTKLMEWQMSGGETEGKEPRGPPKESEQMIDGLGEGEEDVDEGIKMRKDEESKAEAVLEKAGQVER